MLAVLVLSAYPNNYESALFSRRNQIIQIGSKRPFELNEELRSLLRSIATLRSLEKETKQASEYSPAANKSLRTGVQYV